MKTKILSAILSIFCLAVNISANEKILVNHEVTTHIVMPENIKLVDISTTKIIGNQCADNIVRIKPFMESDSIHSDGYKEDELLGTVTLIGERHIAQYDIVYTESPRYAASIYHVSYQHAESYINPEISMPMSEMARYAWAARKKLYSANINVFAVLIFGNYSFKVSFVQSELIAACKAQ